MSSAEDEKSWRESARLWHVLPNHNNVPIYIENKVVGSPAGWISGGRIFRSIIHVDGWLKLDRHFCLEETDGAHESGWVQIQ